jgi:hypothetical protein
MILAVTGSFTLVSLIFVPTTIFMHYVLKPEGDSIPWMVGIYGTGALLILFFTGLLVRTYLFSRDEEGAAYVLNIISEIALFICICIPILALFVVPLVFFQSMASQGGNFWKGRKRGSITIFTLFLTLITCFVTIIFFLMVPGIFREPFTTFIWPLLIEVIVVLYTVLTIFSLYYSWDTIEPGHTKWGWTPFRTEKNLRTHQPDHEPTREKEVDFQKWYDSWDYIDNEKGMKNVELWKGVVPGDPYTPPMRGYRPNILGPQEAEYFPPVRETQALKPASLSGEIEERYYLDGMTDTNRGTY